MTAMQYIDRIIEALENGDDVTIGASDFGVPFTVTQKLYREYMQGNKRRPLLSLEPDGFTLFPEAHYHQRVVLRNVSFTTASRSLIVDEPITA